MQLNDVKQAFAGHFSNEIKIGSGFVKIHRMEFYQEDLDFFYNLSRAENVSVLIKRSGKGVTAIVTVE